MAALHAIDRGIEKAVVVRDVDPAPSPRLKQALVLVKPELLYPGRDRAGILGTVRAMLAASGLSVGGAAVLGPARLADVVAAHYAVINRVSRLGVEGLTLMAEEALRRRFTASTPVLGGHQILARLDVSPEHLTQAWRGARSTKLAPGVYAAALQVGGQPMVALNGFHPEQLAHYTTGDARVVAFEVTWDTPTWRTFRSQIIGATDPYAADARSMRAYVRDNRDALGVCEVSRGMNGVHGSAGPLEAMVELCRFFGVSSTATSFGALAGGSFDRLPMDAGLHELFEATEDCEPDEALLITVRRSHRRAAAPDTSPAPGHHVDT
jgi:hypothetical protein